MHSSNRSLGSAVVVGPDHPNCCAGQPSRTQPCSSVCSGRAREGAAAASPLLPQIQSLPRGLWTPSRSWARCTPRFTIKPCAGPCTCLTCKRPAQIQAWRLERNSTPSLLPFLTLAALLWPSCCVIWRRLKTFLSRGEQCWRRRWNWSCRRQRNTQKQRTSEVATSTCRAGSAKGLTYCTAQSGLPSILLAAGPRLQNAELTMSCVFSAAALNALKKKKMIETQLEQVENNIQRVNEQQGMLENQRMTVETMGALQYGAHASKQTMSDMKITDVDTVLEEISDQADQMSQIQDAMSQPLGAAADMDMDELEAELEVGCLASYLRLVSWRGNSHPAACAYGCCQFVGTAGVLRPTSCSMSRKAFCLKQRCRAHRAWRRRSWMQSCWSHLHPSRHKRSFSLLPVAPSVNSLLCWLLSSGSMSFTSVWQLFACVQARLMHLAEQGLRPAWAWCRCGRSQPSQLQQRRRGPSRRSLHVQPRQQLSASWRSLKQRWHPSELPALQQARQPSLAGEWGSFCIHKQADCQGCEYAWDQARWGSHHPAPAVQPARKGEICVVKFGSIPCAHPIPIRHSSVPLSWISRRRVDTKCSHAVIQASLCACYVLKACPL